MASSKKGNYAFIDGNNLYLGARSQGIKIDYRKLRLYLTHKFNVKKAIIFIGYDPDRTHLYYKLVQAGFELVQKPVVFYYDGDKKTMKGNVDAELVLHSAAVEYNNYDKAIIITSDGDFACLVQFLIKKKKLEKLIATTNFYSRLFHPYTDYILTLGQIKDAVTMPKTGRRK